VIKTERRSLAVNGDRDRIADDLVDATKVAMRLGTEIPPLVHDGMHHLSNFPRAVAHCDGTAPSYRTA
jgi:hypothetical protein